MNRPAFQTGDRIVYDFLGDIRSGVVLDYDRGTSPERDTYLISMGPRWFGGGRWVGVRHIRTAGGEQ